MNSIERKMVDLLKDLKAAHHVEGVKAEFEAEGTRIEEALRLKEVLMKAELPLTIKIGGCEAVRDMYEARVIGVSRIIAPMVESPYALQKFLEAAALAIPADELSEIKLAVNIETIDACERFEAMLKTPGISRLEGIVVGRSDLSCSLGLDRDHINSDRTFEVASPVIARARAMNLSVTVGGGVSAQSLPWFRRFPAGSIDRYETRKVIFTCPAALGDDAEKGILKALQFEIYWLHNKRDFYGIIHKEDEARILTLEKRYRKTMDAMGISA